MPEENSNPPAGLTGIGLRLVFFFLLEIVAMVVFATFLDELAGRLAAGAMGVFLAAVLANALTVRVYERGRLEDVGMGWGPAAPRHLLLGGAAGVLAGLIVTGALLGFGLAVWKPDQEGGFQMGRLLWVSVLLLFGAVGEELLFRGYGFQLLLHAAGPWWIIPISAAIFGWAHHDNIAASPLGLVNTGLWGLLLGYAFYRAGDLWLPIGLHFGWNWILPLLGANLSGFTLGLSGYNMEARGQELWSGGAYGPEASLFTTVVAVALAIWLWKVRLGGPRAGQPGEEA
jgi:membrane protease YdiL (CAAX protease family)